MIARYVRRIARVNGDVVCTLSCGHQRRFSALEWWERVKDHEQFFGEEHVTCLPCPECPCRIRDVRFVRGPTP